MINLELWRDRRNSPRSLYSNWDHFGKEFDSIFNLFDATPTAAPSTRLTACDIQESEQAFLLSLDMPGIRKEDIQIELKENTLEILGQRHRQGDAEATRYRHSERQFGEFRRSFTLPETINGDRIEASFENGVLYISLPKQEKEAPKRILVGENRGQLFENLLKLKNESLNEQKTSA